MSHQSTGNPAKLTRLQLENHIKEEHKEETSSTETKPSEKE
jgi:hypothetical protein|tara:strand:- start:332 stop:454 length:123 start_codon:yes stop_codon:yes gene_type:complete